MSAQIERRPGSNGTALAKSKVSKNNYRAGRLDTQWLMPPHSRRGRP